MPCLPLPAIELPTLPDGISLALPDLGPGDFAADLCCKIAAVSTPEIIPPIPPLVLDLAILALIDTALSKIDSYLDKLPLDCPKE